MNYCKNCGHQLKQNQQFCPKCGNPQNELEANGQRSNLTVQEREPKSRVETKVFHSKKSKILIGSVVVFLLLLFGAFKYIESTITPEKVAAKFANAVKHNDVKEMESILDKQSPNLSVTKDSVKGFIQYFKKHPDAFAEVVNQLKQDVNRIDENPDYVNEDVPVSISKAGKRWVIFNNYVISTKPFFIDVTSNQSPTEVEINGKVVGKVSDVKKTFGPYLLSDFTIKGIYKGEYATVNTTQSLNPLDEGSQRLTADLELDGNMVSIYSNNSDAVLYVNGKSTGDKLGEIETFGPVPTDGSLKVQAVFQDGNKTTKSNIETITKNGQEVDLEFDEDPSIFSDVPMDDDSNVTFDGSSVSYSNDQIQSFMDDYLTASVQAINQRDFSLAEGFLTPDGKSYKESKDYIDYLETKGITEDLLGVTVVDMKSTSNGYECITNEQYTIYYSDGTSKDRAYQSKYLLKIDGSELKVDSLIKTTEVAQ